ncbi:Clusterin-associated protein-1-domain-containing protein [Gorgonomyces haynaldii]|nr:Clusterin-associated protein-1-domain-containing protein [Gorgonomyces haynaldii]
MSIREMKTVTERLRGLGYPKMVSMESFRTPNFEAMADILFWLAKNYDTSFNVPLEFGTEEERVQFVKNIVTWLTLKTQISLNTKKLYMADGYAVKEIMKVVELLHQAKNTENDGSESASNTLDISSKIGRLRECRSLASVITERGAELYDLLGKELSAREVRTNVISKPFELASMEKSVASAINQSKDQVTMMRQNLEGLKSDEANLLAKIEKKKVELDRAEKRLKSLQSVRPAYMDEFEKIELELVKVYEQYMNTFRNLTFLEQQLDEHNRVEQEKMEETDASLKRMQSRLREEELRLLKEEKEGANKRPNRPSGAGSKQRKIEDSEDDSEEDSDDSDLQQEQISVDSDSSGEIDSDKSFDDGKEDSDLDDEDESLSAKIEDTDF